MAEATFPAFDYVLVGGGLQNALIALAVLNERPSARIAMVERDEIGGNHTWSFHEDDVPDGARAWFDALVTARWPGYAVSFPNLERRLAIPYGSISSERLRRSVVRTLDRAGCQLFSAAATRVGPNEVELASGERVRGELVIDARGPESFPGAAGGYQKFVGLELDLVRSAPGAEPVLMDARVPQSDGFRFFYVLPFSAERVLIEDTYFSDRPELDIEKVRREVLAYAARHGYVLREIVREERGVLPLPMRLPKAPPLRAPLVAGVQGGWFHPTTGYSLPVALRLALHVASASPLDALGPRFARLSREHRSQARFATFLNRLLFGSFEPAQRWHVLERFYRSPEATVRRFYALSTTTSDRARIVCGRPPRGFSLRATLAGVAGS